MPVLSFYEGNYEMSFALFNDISNMQEHKLFRFPYVYSKNIFANSFSKEDFYKDVFNLAASQLGVSLTDCDIYTIGILQHLEIPFEIKKSTCLLDSLDENALYIGGSMIALKNSFNSFFPVENLRSTDHGPIFGFDLNFRANLDIYHNIVYYDSRDIVLKDSVLREILGRQKIDFNRGKYIVTGDRIRELDINPALGYLLILDAIKDAGAYFLTLDSDNLYSHSVSISSDYISSRDLGTLVNVPGDAEVLYETDVHTSQLINLKEDNIFIIPLESKSTARVLVKYRGGVLDKEITGGELGLIFDTRDKSKKPEFKDVYANQISQSMRVF